MTDAPKRIWAYPSNVTGWDYGFYAASRRIFEAVDYILATPAALAEAPEVQALIAEAVAQATRVKPLAWVDAYRPVASPEPYQIWPDNGGSGAPDDPIEDFDGFMLYSPHMMALGVHPTVEAAKAAAQADCEARIRAALAGGQQ